ncbi:MAG: DNA mismatch repair endonuclease MutL [Acidobacteria bacterium]|nr:DNA mismatch repair endonuclease MutL [Acidobacteriota bacterium]
MDLIRILDSAVVDRIAAGEVVERPASVVKELVENSLDAGASRVEVRIEAGGRALIEVIDDGHGMHEANATLAFTQHATSKIQDVDDLDSIGTLGFRGEALASIAAVGRVELLTATGDGPGIRARVAEGEGLRLENAAAPVGTRIAVRDLFYNTPARQKHLRTDRTESGRVAAAMEDFALLRPDVHFVLTDDGRERMAAAPVGSLVERVHQVLGGAVADNWLAVEDQGNHCEVVGGTTRPEENRATRSHVHLFVNGRAVADGRLVHAVTTAYDTTLPRGRYPLAALFIQLDPAQVDVNVHPRKAEVRFVEPGAIYGTLRRAVTQAVARQVAPPTRGYAPPLPMPSDSGTVNEMPIPAIRPSPSLPLGKWKSVHGDAPDRRPIPMDSERLHVRGSLQPLGQYANTYILAADEEGLLIIDQHVAHERVLFERVLAQRQAEGVRVQRLLVPEVLELTSAESAAAEQFSETLAAFGFEIEPFGGSDWSLRAVPEILRQKSGERLVRDLLASLSEGRGARAAEVLENDVAASIACHSAVRANQPLSFEVMSSLITELSSCETPMHCPHGRPVMLRMSLSQIEKDIGRH